MATTVADNGISVTVPTGWEAELSADNPTTSRSSGHTAALQVQGFSRLHLANFSLPLERGDFGSGAVELMRRGDVLVCVLEESPAMAGTKLYAKEGLPVFSARDFDPNQMQRPIKGQSGAQAFFQLNGRPFVAYIVFGDHLSRASLVDQVNDILSSLTIS